ncbi:MAG TPA: hypothetical protein VKB84_18480 [Candidatus Binataceae bacterium]|nr:hypothetical protein [Candidatus Binataceae bacterium]
MTNAVGSIQGSATSLDRPAPSSPVYAGKVAPPAKKQNKLWELWAAWKKIARKIGDFQARILLTIFYFVLLAPFALVVRRTSDPLAIKPGAQRGWGVREGAPEYNVEMAHKQF